MKWFRAVVVAVAVLATAATVALPRLVDTPRVQSLIASTATQALARPVKFRSLSVSVWPYPAVRVHGLEIAEDPAFGGGSFVRLDEADLRLKLWPLLSGHLEFAALVLRQPTITLVQGSGGRWNFASVGTAREAAPAPRTTRGGGGGAAPAGPPVSRIVIHKGLVTYERRSAGGTIIRQRLEDVDATLAPRAGALAVSGSARAVPGDLGVKITEGVLGLSGARTLNEASVRARIEVEGRDVGPTVAAVLGPEPAVNGAVSGRLDVAGTLGRPRAAGEFELRGPTVTRTMPACPAPRRRTLALATMKANVSWEDGRLVVQPLTTGVAQGRVTTKLTAVPRPPASAELSDLVVERLPLERVLADFLCQGYALAGPLDLTGTLALSLADPWSTVSGEGRIAVGAGKVVGPRALALLGGLQRVGGADAPGAAFSSPIEFDSIAGSYRVVNGLVSTRDLLYASRAMKARVSGDYALSSGQVNADVVIDHARGQLQAKVTGSADSPSIRVAPSLARSVDAERLDRGFKDLLKKFR